MSGVIVSVKGRYAVLLTKNSDFIKVKNKNYSVGDEVKIPQYKGQILAAAASFIVVCGGISSYFVPAKYMRKQTRLRAFIAVAAVWGSYFAPANI